MRVSPRSISARRCCSWATSGSRPATTRPPSSIDHGVQLPASREELILLFEHLEEELEKGGFLFPPGNRPGMIRNLRSILHRAQLTDQEVRTLEGGDRGADQGQESGGNPPE